MGYFLFSYLFSFFNIVEGNAGKQRLNFNLKPVEKERKSRIILIKIILNFLKVPECINWLKYK